MLSLLPWLGLLQREAMHLKPKMTDLVPLNFALKNLLDFELEPEKYVNLYRVFHAI